MLSPGAPALPDPAQKGSRMMTATAIDSAVFRDIFSTEAMRRVFSDENRIQKYLDFEAGLARAQARLGIIPQEACDEIV
jgi:3-carboxy-cis,cis-muconate cycloisomerase